MTLSKGDKTDLIEYRLNQARETADTATELFRLQKYPASVNRIYYAVFYCLLALALKYEFETSKHLQLIGWFNKNFVATKKVDSKYGNIVRKFYDYRKSADYDAFVVIEKGNIEPLLSHMNDFIAMTIQLLHNK